METSNSLEPSKSRAASAPPVGASANRISDPVKVESDPVKVEFQGVAMGTTITIVAYTGPHNDEAATRAAMKRSFQRLKRVDQLMSSFRNDSELSAINQNAGHFTKVSSETFQVIEKSIWAGSLSDGAFDITFASMGDLWKFGDAAEENPMLPSPALIAERRRHIDYRRVELDPKQHRVRIAADQKLGLGGIAKGYAVDLAVHELQQSKVSNFLVRAGGDLYGAGRKPNGSPWVAGIQDPRGPKGRYFATLRLSDRAFSTAGDYARAYFVNGKRYHHIIDPRTGYPATACRSVTLWAPTALLADAVDDAVFILGPKRGLELIEKLDGVGAVIVDEHNKVWVSERLEGKLKLLRQPTNAP